MPFYTIVLEDKDEDGEWGTCTQPGFNSFEEANAEALEWAKQEWPGADFSLSATGLYEHGEERMYIENDTPQFSFFMRTI